jgi:anti-sigma factor RsiW
MTRSGFEMTDADHLVQRFVDQELSPEERVRFISRLGRDEGLRRRAMELEQLVLETSRLPRPIVPDDFTARVMERAVPRSVAQPGWWQRMSSRLLAPRELRWNLAGALAVACVMLAIGIVVGRRGASAPEPSAAAPGPASTGAASPVLVRLVVLQPGARTVQVAGDFNEWNPARTALEQISDGAWAVTIPLKPGRYEYMFVVDGQRWIADPFAAEQNDDGFGSRNAVLDVRPQPGAQS